jgi:hypothetical protein
MSQDSGVLPALRSLTICTAFAVAFYFFLVLNPVGTLGNVRNYFEYRVRVPVEWIAVTFLVAWIIQRKSGYAAAAAFLVPIFVVILALTKSSGVSLGTRCTSIPSMCRAVCWYTFFSCRSGRLPAFGGMIERRLRCALSSVLR